MKQWHNRERGHEDAFLQRSAWEAGAELGLGGQSWLHSSALSKTNKQAKKEFLLKMKINESFMSCCL